ncbi:MAG: flagellar biosynthesis protein FliQ [Clostridia bacterium]|nr:flagellar biosynthesis protein FliQ [Clostridia bacterium]
MTTSELMEIFRDAVLTGLKIAGPILVLSILVGLVIAVFQAATSVNEQTLTFVPKLVVIGVVMVLFGGWMLQQMVDFVYRIFEVISTI